MPVIFVGGCGGSGIEPLPVPKFGDDTAASNPSPPSDPPTGTFSVDPPPEKYTIAALKACQEIQREVPELPTFLGAQDIGGSDRYWFLRSCAFSNDGDSDPFIGLKFELWENNLYPVGYLGGTDRAKEKYDAIVASGEEDGAEPAAGLNAAWVNPEDVVDGCELSILDGNAVLTVNYDPSDGGVDPRSEGCREGAREFARKFYSAVQPQ
ncbi:hypothetical protein ABT337_13800 [Saccharopolyspora hirsuta]|uniref:hypothetical protein n=1 Tax=Saccharopolyspora hirsuta TaxID=1837 RepID=UPI003323C63F